MKMNKHWVTAIAGLLAGAVNGLLGAGGGMILVPLLGFLPDMEDQEIFSASLGIMIPICLISIFSGDTIAWRESLVWLPGSALGGFLAGKWGKKIPTLWLHKGLGAFILYGGIRYLC